MRENPVLRENGDCMYLYNEKGRMVSAFAKTSDGTFKEYGPSNESKEQSLWRALGIFSVVARIVVLSVAAYNALHTNLSSQVGSAHPG